MFFFLIVFAAGNSNEFSGFPVNIKSGDNRRSVRYVKIQFLIINNLFVDKFEKGFFSDFDDPIFVLGNYFLSTLFYKFPLEFFRMFYVIILVLLFGGIESAERLNGDKNILPGRIFKI